MNAAARMDALRRWRALLVDDASGPNLTARQQAVLVTVFLSDGPATVRGLAADLGLGKPAVSRAVDRLCALGFLKRTADPADGRNICIHRTLAGARRLTALADGLLWCAGAAGGAPDRTYG